MTATEILSELEARGVHVEARGDKLRLRPAEALEPGFLEVVRQHKREILTVLSDRPGPCGSPHCAGCYDIGEGRRLHPPKSGPEWREWLLKWEAKGKVQ